MKNFIHSLGMLLTVLFLSLMIRAQPIYTFINDQQTNEQNPPEFDGQILMKPLKPRIGNDVILSCPVKNLGKYNIIWRNVEQQTLLVVQNVVMTENPRIAFQKTSKGRLSNWDLIIRNITSSDSGYYMCKINTEPPKILLSFLKIYVPIEFDNIESFESKKTIAVRESEDLNITCKANGKPKPTILWRKQDGRILVNSNFNLFKESVESEVLHLIAVSRSAIGDYICIATNELESIRRKLTLDVHFPPTIRVPKKMVNAFVNQNITVECIIESNPLNITNVYWKDVFGNPINSTRYFNKFLVKILQTYIYKVHLQLTIINIELKDNGKYVCLSSNPLGVTTSSIILKVKEFQLQTTTPLNIFQYNVKNETNELVEEITPKSQFDVPNKNIDHRTNSNPFILMKQFNQILIINLILVFYEMRFSLN